MKRPIYNVCQRSRAHNARPMQECEIRTIHPAGDFENGRE